MRYFKSHNDVVETRSQTNKNEKNIKQISKYLVDQEYETKQPKRVKLFTILPQKQILSIPYIKFVHNIIIKYFNEYIMDEN